MASNWIEVVPAYGRDYRTQAAVKTAWNAGQDFQDAFSGRYVNKADAEKYGLSVAVRYDQLRKVMTIR